MNEKRHTYSLKGMIQSKWVATDDWLYPQYQALDDLDFKLNQFEMTFDHEFIRDGEESHLFLKVRKSKNKQWNLEIKKKREQKPKVLTFKDFDDMMNVIHKIFAKH
jgi:hypothetical protein